MEMQAIPNALIKPSTSTWSGVFLGIGIMAGIDEIDFTSCSLGITSMICLLLRSACYPTVSFTPQS